MSCEVLRHVSISQRASHTPNAGITILDATLEGAMEMSGLCQSYLVDYVDGRVALLLRFVSMSRRRSYLWTVRISILESTSQSAGRAVSTFLVRIV